MATKIKGIYKGFKFITQIFVVKEREMEIGYPTDVKHVAHVGWDGPSGSAPSWMNEYKTAPEFSSTAGLTDPTVPASLSSISPWSSQDFEQFMGHQPVHSVFNPSDLPNIPKKSKGKKKTATSSFSRVTTKSNGMEPTPYPQC